MSEFKFDLPNLQTAEAEEINRRTLAAELADSAKTIVENAWRECYYGRELRILLPSGLSPKAPEVEQIRAAYAAMSAVGQAVVYNPAPAHDGEDWCLFVTLRKPKAN